MPDSYLGRQILDSTILNQPLVIRRSLINKPRSEIAKEVTVSNGDAVRVC